jgi:hypothetical protein
MQLRKSFALKFNDGSKERILSLKRNVLEGKIKERFRGVGEHLMPPFCLFLSSLWPRIRALSDFFRKEISEIVS